ncbi:hypothetical protein ACT8ZS_31665 [Paenibacillus sp. M.A.Huq-84]
MLTMLMAASMLIVFAGADFISGGNKAHAASLQILQTVTGNIFYETDAKSFGIATDGDEIDWIYYDYWGNAVSSGSQTVMNGETTLTVSPQRYGWFKLVISAKLNGVVIASKGKQRLRSFLILI